MRVPGSKAIGYLCEVNPGGKIIRECDTFTCQHCSTKVNVPPACKPSEMPGGQCKGCMGLVCDRCYGRYVKNGYICDHIQRKLERQEQIDRWRRQYEEVA